MDADPAGWQALVERSTSTERDQAVAFLASQRDGSLRDHYLDAFSELLTRITAAIGNRIARRLNGASGAGVRAAGAVEMPLPAWPLAWGRGA